MKALKLIAIAIVALAAIVGLLFLNEGSSSTSVIGKDNKLMEKMKSELLSDWYGTPQWDVDLFDDILDRLKQNKTELGNGYQTLVDLTGELASNRLDSLILEEFTKPNCNKQQIDTYSNHLEHLLAKVPHLKNDPEVQKVLGIIGVYTQAYSLTKKSIGLSTGFNAQTDQWNSFSAYRNNIKRQKSDIQGNEYYRYINHITEIADGLAKVESKLASAQDRYKSQLAQDIIKAYQQKDPKDPERLSQVCDRFQRELGNDEALSAFANNY